MSRARSLFTDFSDIEPSPRDQNGQTDGTRLNYKKPTEFESIFSNVWGRGAGPGAPSPPVPRPDGIAREMNVDTVAKNSNLVETTFDVDLLETEEPPKYEQIAEKILHLNQLGLSNMAIARHIDVDGKTVTKVLSWVLDGS